MMFLGRCSGSLQLNHLESLSWRIILQWLPLLLLHYLWWRDILTFLLLGEHVGNLGGRSWLLETALRASSFLVELCSASRWVRYIGYNYMTSIMLTLRAYSSSIVIRRLVLMIAWVSIDIIVALQIMLHLVVVVMVVRITVYTTAIAAVDVFLADIVMRRVFHMLNIGLLVYLAM